MSWATNNYMASSGIPLNSGQSHTYDNTWITKTQLTTKYLVNTSLLSGYGANDWIETGSIAIGSYSFGCIFYNASSGAIACDAYAPC